MTHAETSPRFLVSLIHDDEPLKAMFDFAIKHEFKAVELHGKFHNAETLTGDDVAYLKDVSESNGIALNLHYHHDALPGSHRRSTWENLLTSFTRNIEMLGSLGGKVIVLHPGKIDVPTLKRPEDGSELIRREAIRNLKRFVRSVTGTAEHHGITIGIENLNHTPGYVLTSYKELASVIDDANSDHVGIALDVGHCIIGGGLHEAIEILGNRIRHLHLNDAVDGIEHKEIGIGILDLDEMAPLMSDEMNIEFATLEIGSRHPDAEGIILRSREVLKSHYGTAIA